MNKEDLTKKLEPLKLPQSGLNEIVDGSSTFLNKIIGIQRTIIYTAEELQKEGTIGYKAYEEITNRLEKYDKDIRMSITL